MFSTYVNIDNWSRIVSTTKPDFSMELKTVFMLSNPSLYANQL